MAVSKILVSFCFFLCFITARSENSLDYDHSFIFPLSNFVNFNDESEKFKIGYSFNLNEKFALRFFWGINSKIITSLKPINTEADKKEIKEYYYLNSGLKINLSKSEKILLYSFMDFSLSYDLNKTEGVNFSSLVISEEKLGILGGLSLGIEYFLLKNLSLSIESGIFYETILGKKTAKMGNIIQEDELPGEKSFGIRPFSHLLIISIYF
ncbi:MAG: hypothetical protein N2319_00010 [Candidatus Kapabacteria bacterium]|nr:hypothetical protein [Candidatus Kapabacteria bacterium]